MNWTDLRGRLDSASTAWQLTAALLTEWTADMPVDPAIDEGHGARIDAWSDLKDAVAVIAEQWTDSLLAVDELHAVLDLIQGAWSGLGSDALHAAATGIDEAAFTLFAEDWLPATEEPFVLNVGELFFVPEPDPAIYTSDPEASRATRPSRSSQPRNHELAHVRRHEGDGIEIVIDPRWRRELKRIAESHRPLVAAHTNATLEEFETPDSGSASVYPVTVRNTAAQATRFDDLLDRAIGTAKARVVVLPELSGSPELVLRTRGKVNAARQTCLAIAGSYHEERDGDGVNVAVGVITRSPARLEHLKLAPFWGQDGRKEGIRRGRRLVIYDAGGYRVAIAICKDMLDDDLLALYARLGVTLLLVPAMSSKTRDFVLNAGSLVKRSQTVTLVSNALLEDEKRRSIDPSAVLGQPFSGREVLSAIADADSVPSLTCFRVGASAPIPLK